jgi:hypothetical protein
LAEGSQNVGALTLAPFLLWNHRLGSEGRGLGRAVLRFSGRLAAPRKIERYLSFLGAL